ncbi:MAG: hypothetical protein ACE5KE_01900 [Methanosarcinales archaeon]
MNKNLKKIPNFNSEYEEAEFWSTYKYFCMLDNEVNCPSLKEGDLRRDQVKK